MQDSKGGHANGEAALASKQPYTASTRGTASIEFEVDFPAILSHQVELAATTGLYNGKRTKLLRAERECAWDEPARLNASQVERDANEILLKVRENERIDPALFGNVPGEDVPAASTRDMGGRFLVNKQRIERSRVFNIACKMPKGAHLHLHFNSELPPERLLPHARQRNMENTMCIRSTRPLLEPVDFEEAEIVFDVKPVTTQKGDIFSASYNSNWKDPESRSWMLWSDFRQHFPDNVTIENGVKADAELVDDAERWVREKMITTLRRAYHDRQTLNGAWACFNQGTRAFKGLINYESVYRWYIGAVIDNMIRDNVMYAELRPMLLDKFIPADSGEEGDRLDHKAQMDIICKEVSKKKEQLRREGRLHQFPFGLRIIYATPKSITKEKMQSELADCIRLKLQFPDLICGFDLVGAEDRMKPISFYADVFVGFTNACRELGISIPFMFHAGETLLDTGGSHDPDNSNLYDALLLNAKRIGHGYSILKHPLLVEKYRDKKICLELCPISNEMLHLCGNVRQHNFPELLAAGLECTLNADNPSLYRYVRFSHFAPARLPRCSSDVMAK